MKESFWIPACLLTVCAITGCATSSVSWRECGEGTACSQADCERTDQLHPYAVPVKPGTYVSGWNNAMRCAAKSDEFVIPRNAWFNGGSEPGPKAVQHIHHLAQRMSAGGDHALLEAEPVQPKYSETLADATARTEHLNATRRSAVVAALEANGVTDADSRVHVQPLDALGTRGIEAPQVFTRIFQGTGRGGGQNGAGGGFGGGGGAGFGGGGFGGGRGF